MRIAPLALTAGRLDVRSARTWDCLAYLLLAAARHDGRTMSQAESQRALRAVIRSVSACSTSGYEAILARLSIVVDSPARLGLSLRCLSALSMCATSSICLFLFVAHARRIRLERRVVSQSCAVCPAAFSCGRAVGARPLPARNCVSFNKYKQQGKNRPSMCARTRGALSAGGLSARPTTLFAYSGHRRPHGRGDSRSHVARSGRTGVRRDISFLVPRRWSSSGWSDWLLQAIPKPCVEPEGIDSWRPFACAALRTSCATGRWTAVPRAMPPLPTLGAKAHVTQVRRTLTRNASGRDHRITNYDHMDSYVMDSFAGAGCSGMGHCGRHARGSNAH